MMYPMPYPSAATGPKPNSRSAGFPQFDVDKIDVLSSCQPGSVKIAGSAGLPWWWCPLPFAEPLYPESVLAGEFGRSSFSRSR